MKKIDINSMTNEELNSKLAELKPVENPEELNTTPVPANV